MEFLNYTNLAILSGVEPHRTILQERLYRRFLHSGSRSLIVEGKPQAEIAVRYDRNVTIVSHLSDPMLREALLTAENIYCRSGYSTIMDLYALGINYAVLIPTPGQTEQEYLAEYLQRRGFKCIIQDEV